MGVDKCCVFNWEANTSNPQATYIPAIIEFLGYNPLPPAKNLAEQLVGHRTSLGLTQKEAAERIDVDPTTLARRERGEREPTGTFLGRVTRFLNAEDTRGSLRRAGYREAPYAGLGNIWIAGLAGNFRVPDQLDRISAPDIAHFSASGP